MRTLALGYSLQLSMNELVAEVSVRRNATALFLFLNQWPAIGFMLGCVGVRIRNLNIVRI